MNLKKLTVTALLTAVVSTSALFAYDRPKQSDDKHPPILKTEMLKKKLDLSDVQVSKIEGIRAQNIDKNKTTLDQLKTVHEEIKTLSEVENPDYAKIRKSMEKESALKTDMHIRMMQQHREVLSILTPEQREKFKKMGHRKDKNRCETCKPNKHKKDKYNKK